MKLLYKVYVLYSTLNHWQMFGFFFQIPLNFIRELNKVSNVTELFAKFMPDVNMREAQTLEARIGFQGKPMN